MLSNITVPKLGRLLAPLAVSSTTARSAAIAADFTIIRVTSTVDGFILFGTSAVESTSTTGHFMSAYSPYDYQREGTNFAFISTGASGTVYSSELL